MCVILFKPENKLIRKDLLKACFYTNRDGAGYMYPKDGKVIIRKGFMTFTELLHDLHNTIKYDLGGTTRGTPMVFHFRISTQGGVNRELTHPYPVCDSYERMKDLETECDVAMAHNGIIRACSDYGVRGNNDSMKYIKTVAYPLIKDNVEFYKDYSVLSRLDEARESSRLIFMSGDGAVTMLGNWVNQNGYSLSHPIFWRL